MASGATAAVDWVLGAGYWRYKGPKGACAPTASALLLAGANAVEMDIRFDASGRPTEFQHSTSFLQPCDCSCLPFHRPNNVCSLLRGCRAKVGVAQQLRLIASKGAAVKLVYLDSKVDSTEVGPPPSR